MTDLQKYECLDCPQMKKLPVQNEHRRFIHVNPEHGDPMFCPYCGNRSLIEGEIDWKQ